MDYSLFNALPGKVATQPFLRVVGVVWVLLILATLLTWVLGSEAESSNAKWILFIAFFKARLVLMYFMELKQAHIALRVLTELWCFGFFFALSALYWIS